MVRTPPAQREAVADMNKGQSGREDEDSGSERGGANRRPGDGCGDGFQHTPKPSKLGVLALAGILFFNVSGGPFGTEGLVRSGGPFYSLVGLTLLPILWSYPVGLMTAELGTAFPRDGGYVLWVEAAFGKRAAFQMGWWAWASGVIDTALYPVMFASFLQGTMGAQFSWLTKSIVMSLFAAGVTLINLFGVEIVGVASVAFSVAVLAPVVLLIAICIPNINTSNWVKPAPNPDPVSWVNIALWNLNGWDAAAAIGDEVKDPGKNIPRALSLSMLLVVVPYILTILAATGVDADFGTYHNGRYNDIAEKQGGWIMGGLFALASVCSVMGMFVSDTTTTSFLMSGMAEDGMLPAVFARRFPPHFDSPVLPIAISFTIVNLLLFLPFSSILQADNFLYSLQLLAEIASLIKLRIDQPDLARPFKVNLSTPWLAGMMAFPAIFVMYQLCTSSLTTMIISTLIVAFGAVLGWVNDKYNAHDANGRYAPLP